MQIVLMAGGKGKRLWPLSTDEHPKQFVKILDNKYSMLTSTYKKAKMLSYQKQTFRNKFWVIVNGYGEIIINGKLRNVKKVDTFYINANDKNVVKAINTLKFI